MVGVSSVKHWEKVAIAPKVERPRRYADLNELLCQKQSQLHVGLVEPVIKSDLTGKISWLTIFRPLIQCSSTSKALTGPKYL